VGGPERRDRARRILDLLRDHPARGRRQVGQRSVHRSLGDLRRPGGGVRPARVPGTRRRAPPARRRGRGPSASRPGRGGDGGTCGPEIGPAAQSATPTHQAPAAGTEASGEPAHPAAIRGVSAAPGSPFPAADVSLAAPPPPTVTFPAVSRAYASPGRLGRGLRALDRMRTRRSGRLAREMLRMAMPMLEERIIRRARPGSPVAKFAAARHADWCATTRRSVKQIRREARRRPTGRPDDTGAVWVPF
jgi:hypothetical protein